MSRHDDLTRLRDIRGAAQKAVRFASGRTLEDAQSDEMLLFALVRALEIVGEASKNVSATFRDAHPELPWQPMARTRDRLIHGYTSVNPEIIWRIVTDDLPPLLEVLDKVIPPD